MASRFWVGGTGTWDASDTTHWASSTGGAGGQSVPVAGDTVTFDGSSGGGTATVNTNVSITTLTMSAFTGTLDFSANNNTVALSSSFVNTGTVATRTINMGSGQWTISGSNTTPWSCSDLTGCTFVAGIAIIFDYAGGTGTRNIRHGNTAGGVESNAISMRITAGTDIVSIAQGGNKDIDFTGFSGTLSANTRPVYGNFTLSSTMTLLTGSNVTTFAATSGTQTITSSGQTMDFPITIDGVGTTVQLADSLVMGSTRTFTVTNGTFNANGFNLTVGIFSSSAATTRAITMGSGQWTVTGSGATIWNCATLTACTFTPSALGINFSYSGAVGTRLVSHGSTAGGTETNAISINVTAGSDTFSISNSSATMNLNYTGFSGTAPNFNLTIYGNLTYGAAMTVQAGFTITFSKTTAGTQLVTSNGVSVDRALTINVGTTTTVSFADDFNGGSTRTITVTQGIFDDGGKIVSVGYLASVNSNVRSVLISGILNLTGFNGVSWNTSTATNLTFTQTGVINMTYSGSSNTRTIRTAATLASSPSINITAGTDIINFTGANNLNFTGFAGTITNNATATIFGFLTIPSGITITSASTSVIFAATSGTKTITIVPQINLPITINGVGGTFQLGTALDMSGVSQRTFTVTNGTFNTVGYSLTCAIFDSSNSNTRSISLGSSTVTLTGTGTVWSLSTTTGLTFSAGTSTIKLNNASSSSKTFAGGTLTYYNLQLTGAGTGTFIIGTTSSTTTFNSLIADTGPKTVQIFAGKTLNVTLLAINGTAGNLITLQSTISGTQWNIVSTTGNPLSVQYVSLQDSNASPPFFFAYGSVDVSNNTGWSFKPATIWTDVPKPSNTVVTNQEGTPIGLLLALTYSTTDIIISGWTNVAKATGTSWTNVN